MSNQQTTQHARRHRGRATIARHPHSWWARMGGIVATLALALGSAVVLTAPAEAAGVKWTMKSPFAREIARRGDVDADPYHIEHVYELQYRLRWMGLLRAQPNGVFGPQTERAVKRFQKRLGLKRTGVADYRVWKPLIKRTVRGERAVPKRCHAKGWHACYDRTRHQVNLYHRGRLVNSWLVRGGAYDRQTRVGHFRVYWRDIDHTSRAFGGAPMPYSQFFSGGEALHGSRYMVDPFEGHSHGCVNFWVEDARQLWRLTSDKRLHVHVYGAWD
ncbi:MAG TPA: L,D-transpeptidase family protein [Nocardioidaceae bacterium]|nr:L,D-transpeptidase family protein [Nocardioidaceae bacterium]